MKHLIPAAYILAGSLAVALGIGGFLTPNHFIDGGVTGISMLVAPCELTSRL